MRWHRTFAAIAGLILLATQAHAQQPVHRVAFLATTQSPERIQAWEKELRDRGFVVRKNLQIAR
jgi:hypothetical protein